MKIIDEVLKSYSIYVWPGYIFNVFRLFLQVVHIIVFKKF